MLEAETHVIPTTWGDVTYERVESPWLFVWVISIMLRHTRQGQGEGDNWLQESPLARVAYMDDLGQQ